MMHSQYLRIEHAAGGAGCSNREFIRAAHAVLSKRGKSSAMRSFRHDFIRDGLAQLTEARLILAKWRI